MAINLKNPEKKIINIIDSFFLNKNIKSFSPLFDKEDFFGLNKNIRVLKTAHCLDEFLIDLKLILDQFKVENHIIYNPHVSTSNYNRLQIPFVSYVLVEDGKIYKEWIFKTT